MTAHHKRNRKPKTVPTKVGNDPALWRYQSVQAAIVANTEIVAQLIRAGQKDKSKPDRKLGNYCR